MALYTLDPDSAQANYYAQRVKFFGKLKVKLDNGEVTQQYYDDAWNTFKDDLQNPDNLLAQAGDFDMNKFIGDVSEYAAKTAGTAVKIVANAASSAALGAGEGAIKGLGVWSIVIVLGLAGYLYWKFGKRL